MDRCDRKEFFLYAIAILLSFLLSLINRLGHPVFNPDGVFYFQVAETYLSHGFHAATTLFNWPFYPISVAWLSRLTHLSLYNAGYLMNVVCSAAICVVFARVVRHLNRDFVYQCLAVLLILIWHVFAKLRADLTRDQGFWLFGLLSLLAFFHYVKTRKMIFSVLWFLALSMATLYRMEGTFILLTAPLAMFFLSGCWRERLIDYFKLNLPLIVIVLFFVFGFHAFFHSIWGRAYGLLNHSAQSGRVFSLITSPVSYMLVLFNSISMVYWLLFVLAFFQLKENNQMKFVLPVSIDKIIILLSYLLPCVLITLAFYTKKHFLEPRYLLLLLSLCLSLAPFGLYFSYQLWKSHRKNFSVRGILFPVIVVLLLAELVADLYPFGTSHRYVMQAANWVKQNVSSQTMLYTCKGRLAILADRTAEGQSAGWRINDPGQDSCGTSIEFPSLAQYNGQPTWVIYAVDVNGHDGVSKYTQRQVLVKRFGEPLAQFENRHHDAMLLFKAAETG